MKRYIALLACAFALVACGSQSDGDNESADTSASNGSNSSAGADAGTESGAESGTGTESAADSESGSGGDSSEFANPDEKRSYALGMDIGNSLTELPVEIDTEALSQGVSDTVSGGETRLSQKELDKVMQSFVQDMESAQQKKAQQQAQTNLEKGQEFLAENKKKDGVKTTDSGLQYKVGTKGDGPSPDANDSVTVHYEGKLIDGTVFDSSRERGEPVTFPVNAVIPGWTEALQLMKEGAKYKLFIPADLAYGERGAGAQIGPNETLIFDVELIKVDKNEGTETSEGDDTASGGKSESGTGNGQTGSADSQNGSADGQTGSADSQDETESGS